MGPLGLDCVLVDPAFLKVLAVLFLIGGDYLGVPQCGQGLSWSQLSLLFFLWVVVAFLLPIGLFSTPGLGGGLVNQVFGCSTLVVDFFHLCLPFFCHGDSLDICYVNIV